MKNNIGIYLLSMLLALPLIMQAAEEKTIKPKQRPAENNITLISMDERHVEVPREVAKLSIAVKRTLHDVPTGIEIPLPKITGKSLQNIAFLMEFAYKFKDDPLKVQIDRMGAKINEKLTGAEFKTWISLLWIINYLNIEILKKPLADSMIKYIYQLNSNRDQIAKFISDLVIPTEFKVLLAKYWYLNYGKGEDYIELFEKVEKPEPKQIPVVYGFSVEELAAYNKLPRIDEDKQGKLYTKLDLENLRINDLKGLSKIPKITSVRMLKIAGNYLSNVSAADFEGLNNLVSLELTNDQLGTLPEDLLKHLSHLSSFGVEENHLKSLPENLLKDCKELNYVYLKNIDLENLPANLIKENNKLVAIYFDFNRLTTIPTNFFKGHNELTYISINNNKLTEFPLKSIEGLTKLIYLGLISNPLSQENKEALQAKLGDRVRFH